MKKPMLALAGLVALAAAGLAIGVAVAGSPFGSGSSDTLEHEEAMAGDGEAPMPVPPEGSGSLEPGGDVVVNPDEPVSSGPITSIDDIDPDECNLVHNVDACERQAVATAKGDLTQRAGAAEEDIAVESVEFVEWPDGCLGIERPEMACILMVTPGYRVILSAGGQAYEYHTDLAGHAELAE